MPPDKQATKDVARLVESAVASAQRRLGKGVAFAPFGFALGPNGRGVELTAEASRPSSAFAELVEVVGEGLRTQQFRAAVVAFLSSVTPPGSKDKWPAIGLQVHHAKLPSKKLLIPLERGEKGKITVAAKPPTDFPNLWS